MSSANQTTTTELTTSDKKKKKVGKTARAISEFEFAVDEKKADELCYAGPRARSRGPWRARRLTFR